MCWEWCIFKQLHVMYSGLLIAMPAVTNPWLQNQKHTVVVFVFPSARPLWKYPVTHQTGPGLGSPLCSRQCPRILTHADVHVHTIWHYLGFKCSNNGRAVLQLFKGFVFHTRNLNMWAVCCGERKKIWESACGHKSCCNDMGDCWGQRETKLPFIFCLLAQAPETNYL